MPDYARISSNTTSYHNLEWFLRGKAMRLSEAGDLIAPVMLLTTRPCFEFRQDLPHCLDWCRPLKSIRLLIIIRFVISQTWSSRFSVLVRPSWSVAVGVTRCNNHGKLSWLRRQKLSSLSALTGTVSAGNPRLGFSGKGWAINMWHSQAKNQLLFSSLVFVDPILTYSRSWLCCRNLYHRIQFRGIHIVAGVHGTSCYITIIVLLLRCTQ